MGGSGGLRALAGLLREALFPGRCLLCGEWLGAPGPDDAPVCDDCRRRLAPISRGRCERCGTRLVSEKGTCMRCREAAYGFESNVALFAHEGQAKALLRCFKFEGRTRLTPFFAAHAADAIRGVGAFLPIVPVPPRPRRERPDPAELVARCLERGYGMDVRRLLERSAGTQQKSLDFTRRRENLAGKIRLRPAAGPVPTECILLDDVFTTGATMDACARVLKEAGCRRVYGLTLVIEE